MKNKCKTLLVLVLIAMSFVFMISTNHFGSALAQSNSTKNATQGSQQTPTTELTDTQRYNNGYKDGLKNSRQDFKNQSCDPTVPTDVVHTAPYKEGYPVGYSKGPCGGQAPSSSLQSNSSASPIPGLLPLIKEPF